MTLKDMGFEFAYNGVTYDRGENRFPNGWVRVKSW
jgi:hypothetical protein